VVTPFVAPEALKRQLGRPLDLRLGANESAFGPSPKALEAMRLRASRAQNYGDPESLDLRTAIALQEGTSVENVLVASGIDELLSLFCRLFVNPGDAVVTTLGSYPTFDFAAAGAGARIERVRYRDDQVDLDALVGLATAQHAKIVYLANPDNPSGSWQSTERIREFTRRLPANSVLLLDEAYHEFAPSNGIRVSQPPNVVRLRTFSKAHGLAGCRIGFALAHPAIVQALQKIRMHFGVNAIAQAGALASLGDPGHVQSVVERTLQGRGRVEQLARELGLCPLPSATNFVAIDVGSKERAQALLRALLEHGVFLRMPSQPPLDRCIRVTIGQPEAMERFGDIFTNLIKRGI